MKISRMGHEVAEQSRLVAQASGDQVHDLAFALERAIDGEQTRAQQLLALPLREVVPDDDVDHARLVLERDEGDATRGTWTLSPGDEPRDARNVPMRQGFQFRGSRHALAGEPLAQPRNGLPADWASPARLLGA